MGWVAWGIYSLQYLPVDAVPDVTDNQVQIITNAPTLAAQEVEQLLTYPLEMALSNIPEVVEVRSISRFGLSVITVVFKETTDIYLARQLISERLKVAEANLPDNLGQPEMGPITTGLGEIYQYVLYAKKGFEEQYDATALRSLQDWVVKRQLTGIEGVIEINSSGGHLKQYEVAFDSGKLKSMQVSLAQLIEALENNNNNTGGSYIERKDYTYFIRGEGRLTSIADIENVVVKNIDGIPILVKDVANVQIGHAPRFGAVTMNGRGEVVAGQVMMLKGANSAEVTERVKVRMKQIEASLPEGVGIEPYLDRSKLVNRTTKTVINNLVEGGLIVVFVLVLLLGNWRAGLIVASVIPLAMLFAISMMRIFGISANLMSLGAIDFGLVVDGAVIIVEAILHHLGIRKAGQKLSRAEMDEEIYVASAQIRQSAAFGEIIILIVYLPILLLTGIEGKMFRPMALTVSFAILGALILSLTYVPMVSSLVLKREITAKKNWSDHLMAFFYRMYVPILNVALRFKGIFLAATVLVFAISLFQFSHLGGEFIPTLEEGDFALHQILPPGSSIAKGVEVSAELQNILLDKFPEVEKVVTKIGTAEIPTDIMPMQAGDIFVILKPKEEWTSGSTKEELFEKMELEMNKFPGVFYEFTQPIQMRFNELMTGARQDIAIKLYGEDLGILAQKAKEAEAVIKRIEGVGDVKVEATTGLQQMVVRYNFKKMARYGVDAATISRAIRAGFAGYAVGHIFEGTQQYDLTVRLNEENRQTIDDLRNLFITLPNGEQIPLDELASVQFEEGPTQISRDNTQRRITIGVNARGRDVASLVEAIQTELAANVDLPTAYYFTYGGAFENLQRAQARLLIAVPAALALIFVLLYLTFSSIKLSVLIFTAVPMSAIGGIWALWLRDMPFSISAGVGFIALFGVAVLNGIVLIAYFERLKKEGMSDLMQRIRVGTEVRLRPVLMTALVASLGFIPMALSTSAGAEVQQPLATVVIGGLITATFLTLIILPILYYFIEKGGRVNKSVIAILLLGGSTASFAQPAEVTLEEAIEIGVSNYPYLRVQQLQADRATKLSAIKATLPRTTIFLSGEEIDLERNEGIHALGFQQNFNLPKVNRSQQQLYQQQALLANQQLALTENELAQNISLAYYELVFYKNSALILADLETAYQSLVRLNQQKFELGEIGKLPLLAAQDQLRIVEWRQTANEQKRIVALTMFNNWLYAEQVVDAALDELSTLKIEATVPTRNHPALRIAQQQIEVEKAQIATQQAQLLPQVQTGLQVQTINGAIPFWSYQLGVNVPIFRNSQQTKIDAANIQLQIAKTQQETIETELAILQQNIVQQLQSQQVQLEQLRTEVLPNIRERKVVAESAFRAGEASYLEYMQAIDQEMQYELEYLNLLKTFYEWTTRLKYLQLDIR